MGDVEWASEFERFKHVPIPHQSQNPHLDVVMHQQFQDAFQAAMDPSYQNTLEVARRVESQLTLLQDQWSQEFEALSLNPPSSADLKGKGKLEEKFDADWDTQFQSALEHARQEQSEDRVEFGAAFEDVWRNVKEEDVQQHLKDMHSWEDEFANQMPDDDQFGMRRTLEKTYVFEENNPFLQHPDAFAEGMRLLKEGASLSDTALAFEAAVQKDPHNAEAWARLGIVQAENEKEDPAIAALQQATCADSNHLEAVMALAVSYTNEGYDEEAFKLLDQWIGIKYPEIHSFRSRDRSVEDMAVYEVFDRVQASFREAARKTASGDTIDSDLQVGLGILFYNSGQYDKAVDCFSTALKVNPRDYLLWNRLGATLANSGRSEEAIDAYFHALDIKPSFVRARYNLGVSCMNIGCYKEAAEHFLSALSMHQSAPERHNISVNLWETLKRTFILMDRRDLADKTTAGADVKVFRSDFDF